MRARDEKKALGFYNHLLSELYSCYKELVHDKFLKGKIHEQKAYLAIIDESANEQATYDALRKLTKYLEEACGEQVILLVDEYDTPMHAFK